MRDKFCLEMKCIPGIGIVVYHCVMKWVLYHGGFLNEHDVGFV